MQGTDTCGVVDIDGFLPWEGRSRVARGECGSERGSPVFSCSLSPGGSRFPHVGNKSWAPGLAEQ